jgi:hypothetical protein
MICGQDAGVLSCSRNARPRKDEEGVVTCPTCSQNAHDETVLVRCAQWRAAVATPLTRGEEDWKALAWANGTSQRASGWAGEKVARNRNHSRPLARQPLSRRLEGRKEEKGRGWGGWDDFLGIWV